jgi:hypothetical protein
MIAQADSNTIAEALRYRAIKLLNFVTSGAGSIVFEISDDATPFPSAAPL